ncbi:MAG: VanZ family protein [Verrucomicrobiota bacterium]
MLKPRTFAKYWLPVLGWMVVIYSASGDRKSAQHSSRLIEPLVRWFFPHLTNETVWLIVLLVRKCAHLTEYAILALLLWWAWRASAAPGRGPGRGNGRGRFGWSWSFTRRAMNFTSGLSRIGRLPGGTC